MIRFFLFAFLVFPSLALGVTDSIVHDSNDDWLSSRHSATGSEWDLWTAGGYTEGNIEIQNGVVRYSGHDVVFLSDAVIPGEDYTVEADFILDSAKKPAGYLALLARASETRGTAYWLGYDHSTGLFELLYVNPAYETTLAEWPEKRKDRSPLLGTHRVRLEVTGSDISVYLDAKKIMAASDISITEAGQTGIGVGVSGDLTALDNFTVRMMSVTAPPTPAHRGVTDPDIGAKAITDFPKYGAGRTHREYVRGPMTLSQRDTEYVLQNDIAAPGTAFFITANGVTLNLNGYKITYGTADPKKPVYGVRAASGLRTGVAIVNGRIEQAPASGHTNYVESHAIFGGYDQESGQSNFKGLLAAGLEILYWTPTTCGISNHYADDAVIHHNSLRDTGRIVSNRNQLWTAIRLAEGSGQSVHHNHIAGARHGGIRVKNNAEIFQNIIEVDSADTNALGITAYAGENVAVYNNTIVGTGVHTAGIYFGSRSSDIRVFKNHVETRNTLPAVSLSDGYQSSSAFRTSFGLKNSQVYDNTFITWGKKDAVAPGVDTRGWTMFVGLSKEGDSLTIRDNTILGLSEDGKGMAYAVGIKENLVSGVRFEGNIIESNYGNISLGDGYGASKGYPVFRENTLVKNTDYPAFSNYRTVDMNELIGYESTGIMLGNSYRSGADIHSLDWPSSPSAAALRDLGIGWIYTLTVKERTTGKGLPGIRVTITDASGTVVFDEFTDSDGLIQAELIEYWITNSTTGEPNSPFPGANRDDVGPYTVVVNGGEPRVLEIRSNMAETVILNTRKGPKK